MLLPGLIANIYAGVYFTMQIFLSNTGQQLLESPLGRSDGFHNELSIFQRDLDNRVILKSCIFGEGFGDSQGQTVAPFLNFGQHIIFS